MPAHELAQRLPEREFVLYQHYAAKRMLPWRRIQLQLARLSMIVAAANGAKNIELSDFLFDPLEDAPQLTAEEQAESAREFFGFAPRKG